MHLKDLKSKNPSELLKIAEELRIENAGTLRKQDMIFAILKQMASNKDAIYGEGVLEILQDGSPLEKKDPWASMPNIGKW